MFSFLKNHPFAVEAFFENSLVLTFAVRIFRDLANSLAPLPWLYNLNLSFLYEKASLLQPGQFYAYFVFQYHLLFSSEENHIDWLSSSFQFQCPSSYLLTQEMYSSLLFHVLV